MSRQTACNTLREKTLFRCEIESFWELTGMKTSKIFLPCVPCAASISRLETISRHVEELRPHERSAAELLPGHRLRGNERLILQVVEEPAMQPPTPDSRPAQTLKDWTHIYEGLSEEEIDAIDTIAKTRTILTRDLPGR